MWPAITKVWSISTFVCRYVASPSECYYKILLCCDYFSSSSVLSRAFSVQCVYSKFRQHPHLLGYLCAKFRFFRDLHCWASRWRKIVYSQSLSFTQPAHLMCLEPKHLRFRIVFFVKKHVVAVTARARVWQRTAMYTAGLSIIKLSMPLTPNFACAC